MESEGVVFLGRGHLSYEEYLICVPRSLLLCSSGSYHDESLVGAKPYRDPALNVIIICGVGGWTLNLRSYVVSLCSSLTSTKVIFKSDDIVFIKFTKSYLKDSRIFYPLDSVNRTYWYGHALSFRQNNCR